MTDVPLPRFSRRAALTLPFAAATARRSTRAQDGQDVVVSVDPVNAGALPFESQDFGTVGVFDVDWLLQPRFTMMLDNLAASPGAFHGVRTFGAFTAGTLEAIAPDGGGSVWPSAGKPIDFSKPFRALEALTTRGLVPFVVLGFFPRAVSPSPIQPPATWDAWKTLVRAFFAELAGDSRFGAEAIAEWRFEVWNEPNERRFWLGTVDDYFALYRATSEAVAEAGIPVRLGGPAIAYKPEAEPADGPPWMERFLRFIAADPRLQCDFVSLHRKGTVGDDAPDPRRLAAAATRTADQALAIDAKRFAGLTVVNDEADEKVGFEVPYAARMDERGAAWLGSVIAIHAALGERYRESGLRFIAAADNANLQLVRAPFDGRRSIMTRANASETDLLKVPAYGFYELLRLLGNRHGTLVSGAEHLFPQTDIYHLVTAADLQIAALLTYYPDPGTRAPAAKTLSYTIADLPWTHINVGRFQIDRVRSNAYAASGGNQDNPFPVPAPARLPAIRQAQEIALARPIARNVPAPDGMYREALTLEPFTTLCLWITPVLATAPVTPAWQGADLLDGNVILRWTPNREAFFLSYEVFLLRDGVPPQRLSPDLLRAALWVDTAPPPGRRVYGVRAVSASGVASPMSARRELRIGQ